MDSETDNYLENGQRKELTELFKELGVKGIKSGEIQHQTHHNLLGLYVTFNNQKNTLERFCKGEDLGIKICVDPIWLNLEDNTEIMLNIKAKTYIIPGDKITKEMQNTITQIMAKYNFSEAETL